MNYVCGLSKFHWPRFALWGMAGEVVWVSIYVGLGYTFADSIAVLASVLANASGFVTAFGAVVVLGFWLHSAVKKRAAEKASMARQT